jgi:ParB family chromosome partitioning protein
VPKAKTGENKTTSDALFDKLLSSSSTLESAPVSQVFTRLIVPNPRQPRKEIDPETFKLLVSSIAAKGIQQPLIVRPSGRTFELVAGQRRLLAAQRLDLQEVPVIVRELSDAEALEMAIIENLTRENLNPVDETDSVLQLLSFELGRSVEDTIALLYRMQHDARGSAHNVMGMPENQEDSAEAKTVKRIFTGLGKMTWGSFVQNRLPILSFPPDLLGAVRVGRMQYTKAKELNKVRDERVRQEIMLRVIENGLSLADTRKLVVSALASESKKSDNTQEIDDIRRRLVPKRLDKLDSKKRKRVDALLQELRGLLETV